MIKAKTDWNVVTQGFLTVLWCSQSCAEAESKNSFADVFSAFLRDKSYGVLPINVGTLMMASYLMFVYPRERELEELPYDNIDIAAFNQTIGAIEDKVAFIRKLRNALAHGRWRVINETIEFQNASRGEVNWEAAVHPLEFGEFLNQFYRKAMFKALTGSPNPTLERDAARNAAPLI